MGKNPLYVVTNSGKDVEAALGFLDAMVKKLGLRPLIDLIEELIQIFLENITSYPMLVAFNEFLSDLVVNLIGKFQQHMGRAESVVNGLFAKP